MSETSKTGEVSRRGLLKTAASAAGAAAVLGVAVQPAAAKMSQKAVAYQDTPLGDKTCDTCSNWRPPNGCATVEGEIAPKGYCRIFVLKR
ncbi:twin-arginine translocation signal domain-containing protein [Rhodoplanes serenus]|jgi:secreted PhoX family phosphatase|uniref:twin-arginine translocation signal domain-containing protein n=1 Tax=Rhodoplanes serenus TaxID=200615 RepID=UPI000DAEB9AF|nr:twin-arginine translocation signal domain-containing protein [Rhodoplanes serenus]MBI5112858.1 twin-arginine translocation signal domain-containing protein [Rhodovulum sp.]RAI33930.1 hypothetical protein CH340_10675 [Rhodoplanes serenus]